MNQPTTKRLGRKTFSPPDYINLRHYFFFRKHRDNISRSRGETEIQEVHQEQHPKLLDPEHIHWTSTLRADPSLTTTTYEPCDPRVGGLTAATPDLQVEVQAAKDGTYHCRPCRMNTLQRHACIGKHGPHVYESPQLA